MSKKVKILLVGPVHDQFTILSKKLNSLHSSKAGPFDICFCVGPIQLPKDFYNNNNNNESTTTATATATSFPMPVYIQEYTKQQEQQEQEENGEENINGNNDKDENKNDNNNNDDKESSSIIIPLGNNLFHMVSKSKNNPNIPPIFKISIPNCDSTATTTTTTTTTFLSVAICSRNLRVPIHMQQQQQQHQNKQQQCDLLLSTDWPQGMEDVLQVDTEPLSYDVAEIALAVKPRYHFAPSTQYYHTSPPYYIPNSDHVARFIALAPVVSTTSSSSSKKAAKTNKFIHALGLVPLSENPPPTTAPSTLPCPFLSNDNHSNNNSNGNNSNNNNVMNGNQKIPAFAMQAMNSTPAYSRFADNDRHSNNNNNNNKRSRSNNDGNNNNGNDNNNSLQPPTDPSVKTLFLYGLHKDVTGELQSTSSIKVLQAFSKYSIEKVRHPPNTPTSTYCFLEFPTQEVAMKCLLDCQGRFTIDGVDLTLKWATPNNNNNKRQKMISQQQQQYHYMTHEEAANSITLYFHPPKKNSNKNKCTDEKSTSTSTTVLTQEFATCLQEYLQKTLEDALNEGNDDDAAERVTAETEPALAVQVRIKESFGFLEFASHAAATMALAAVTKSTDGGIIVANDPLSSAEKKGEDESGATPATPASASTTTRGPPKELIGTVLRWAKGEAPKPKLGTTSSGREEVLEALGLKRQYYPADSRTDCWFCLASPTCETHLIAGVYDQWYATLPKGGIHRGHVLLVPVEHTHSGAWTMTTSKQQSSSVEEWCNLVQKLQQHASKVYDMDLFVFERAMMTKGAYHTHIQCVPIPRNCSTKLQATMMAHGKACGFDLRPIQSDLSMSTLLSSKNDNNGDGDSYFYAEIMTNSHNHRFLYKHNNDNIDNNNSSSSQIVPLQFAREVLASVLNDPKLAHWKSCVVNKEEETKMTNEFRESFASCM